MERDKQAVPISHDDLSALAAKILASVERHPERVALATRALIGDGSDMRAYLARFKDEE